MDRTKELEEQVLKLSLKVDEMRNRMVRLEGAPPEHQNGTAPRSRRGFLRMGLAAAVAAAGAVGLTALKAVPGSAATGGNVILGNANSANATTSLLGVTLAPAPTLAVEDQNFNAGTLTTALNSVTPHETFSAPLQALGDSSGTAITEGLDAWAAGPRAYGVYGFTDSGTGVTGEAVTGIGLYARASGRIRQDAQATAVAPTYSPNLYEQVRDANGVLWIHNAAGVWRRVNSLRFDTADGLGGFFAPFRLVDTRSGGIKPSHDVASYVVPGAAAATGASTIPADAIGVVGNLTAVGYASFGFLTIFPTGVAIPAVSSVNFITGQGAVANAFTLGLGAGGAISVYVGSPGPSHYIIDITGYIQ